MILIPQRPLLYSIITQLAGPKQSQTFRNPITYSVLDDNDVARVPPADAFKAIPNPPRVRSFSDTRTTDVGPSGQRAQPSDLVDRRNSPNDLEEPFIIKN